VILVVTGTGTGVGKTIVTAALASAAVSAGRDVAVVKPAQTGVGETEPGDLDEVSRLAGLDSGQLHEFARFPDPLAPAAAAQRVGRPPLDVDAAVHRVAALDADDRLVLVEGAGGLLVRYDDAGRGLTDIAGQLSAPVLVVTEAGLGTLNATELTLEALDHRGLRLAGVVIGAWPAEPDLAARCNVTDLEAIAGRRLDGALPAGAGVLPITEFADVARAGLSPAYGGSFDADAFRGQASDG
jgi:dethiobiotin synthetase